MKNIKFLLMCFLVPAAALVFNGCILDAFKTLVQNMPIDGRFTLVGTTKELQKQTTTFRLDSSSVYQKNRDKIKQLRFKAAGFCVDTNTVPSLQGDLILTVKRADTGELLFTKTLIGFKPDDYRGITAKNLDLSDAEIGIINVYLSNSASFESISFTAELTPLNVTPTNTPVILKCFVSIVFEMTVNL
jgi:hypothetical protein